MYAIVVVAYNREKSLLRLLQSLKKAYYESTVDLIISIDKSDNVNVTEIAEQFCWEHGKKIVRRFKKKQGLKAHILSCGKYLDEYEAIAVLEDDLIVSPFFYYYMEDAIQYYADDNNIAGISLYSPSWNQIANQPFQPLVGSSDTYFIQYAQSWGQIWLSKQWKDFYYWYNENQDVFGTKSTNPFPKIIENWPESSWLKYHIRYCVEKMKFFVYPYASLTTNFTEIGTHYNKKITRYQVPIIYEKKQYQFAKLQPNALKYDVFFENITMIDQFDDEYKDINIDLYGTKQLDKQKQFLLSTNLYDYKVIKSFALELRPQEANILENLEGQDIFLYDTKFSQRNKMNRSRKILTLWNYYSKERFLEWNEIIPVCKEKIISAIFKH